MTTAARRAPAEIRARLSRRMLKTIVEQRLVVEGDRVLVAVSGGKDSYTLADLLESARRRAPVAFELVFFHLDQGQPGHAPQPLARWFESQGLVCRIERADTYSTVVSKTAAGDSYCALCSRLRRGVLYTAAERLGCNKVALGHHRDDGLETLLLNLFYSGRLQAMPARYRTGDGRFEVIRPLIECAESEIVEHARAAGYAILPCRLCGSQDGLKRERVKRLLVDLEREIPDLRSVMLAALKNVRPSHLLDSEVAAAWSQAAERYPTRR